jgi:hypothetical protein
MKSLSVMIVLLLVLGCNQHDSKPVNSPGTDTIQSPGAENTPSSKDSTVITPGVQNDSLRLSHYDSLLLNMSADILAAIKANDFKKIASFIHPQSNIRFSPYGYVDTLEDKIFSAEQLLKQAVEQRIITWGVFDGKGTPIRLSIQKYFARFVYDVDFLHAEKKSVNKFLGLGNSLNNLKNIYPGCDFTEFYFSGFDPQYNGMDWRTLRLVFKKDTNQLWLVAIIHDEWTI